MSTLEARIASLERGARKTLPVYLVELEDGTQRRMDALDLLLHLDERGAGMEDRQDIRNIQTIAGTLPTGAAWDSLRKEINKWEQSST